MARRGDGRDEDNSARERDPGAVVQHRGRHAEPAQPVLHPGTGEPVGPDDLAPLFPMELILQEVSEDAEIAIPEAVRNIYRLWRPTPLYRAHRLEAALGTRSRIFYKYEGVSPAAATSPTRRSPKPTT
jgi:tryptophan synthase beta chain